MVLRKKGKGEVGDSEIQRAVLGSSETIPGLISPRLLCYLKSIAVSKKAKHFIGFLFFISILPNFDHKKEINLFIYLWNFFFF